MPSRHPCFFQFPLLFGFADNTFFFFSDLSKQRTCGHSSIECNQLRGCVPQDGRDSVLASPVPLGSRILPAPQEVLGESFLDEYSSVK